MYEQTWGTLNNYERYSVYLLLSVPTTVFEPE